jgi:hypothetical protein
MLALALLSSCSKSFSTPILQKTLLANEEVELSVVSNPSVQSTDLDEYIICVQFTSAESYQRANNQELFAYLMDGIREDLWLDQIDKGTPCLTTQAVFDPSSYRAFVYMGFPKSPANCIYLKAGSLFQHTLNFCDHD